MNDDDEDDYLILICDRWKFHINQTINLLDPCHLKWKINTSNAVKCQSNLTYFDIAYIIYAI